MSKEFDMEPIITENDIILKGFRVRKRDILWGCLLIACFIVIIILAALLAAAKQDKSRDSTPCIGNPDAQKGGDLGSSTLTPKPGAPATTRPTTPQPTTLLPPLVATTLQPVTPVRSTTPLPPPPPSPPPCTCPPGDNSTCLSTPCLKVAAHVLDLLNTSVSPCDDFHKYACGRFPVLNPLSPDEDQTSTFLNVYHQNQERLRRLLEEPTVSTSSNSYDRKLKDFFSSCQDHFYKMQQRGRPLLDKVLRKMSVGWWALGEGWSADRWDLNTALKTVHVDFWTDAFFTFSLATDQLDWRKRVIEIDLSGIVLPTQYYTDAYQRKPQNDYKTYIRTVGSLLLRDAGLNISETERTNRVERFASDAYSVEEQIAKLKKAAQSTLDPHAMEQRMTLRDLTEQTGRVIDWVAFFQYMFDKAPVSGDTLVVILEKDYVFALSAWIKLQFSANATDAKRSLHNYMAWRLIHHYVLDLSWDYTQAFHKVLADINGVTEFQDTWQYCVDKLDNDMSDALGALFVRDHFVDENRQKAHEITDYIRDALIESLSNQLHWMSNQTRDTAITKVRESIIKLGYPDYMMNETSMNQIYGVLVINQTDYFSNLLSFNKFFKDIWNNHMTNPGDTSVWAYPTYSFNAEYYNPWKELIVPAGLLQFPIYDHTSPHYMNFGSMGAIVGRQLVHAVDIVANQYKLDGSGKATEGTWWSNDTVAAYKVVRQCIIDAYINATQRPFQSLGITFSMPVNMNYYSPLALGESSGVKLALRAYRDWASKTGGEKRMPGATLTNDQAFFVAYAQSFCYNRTPLRALSQIINRPWTVQENVQVNYALAQLREFQDAFQCNSWSKMVAPKRCQLY